MPRMDRKRIGFFAAFSLVALLGGCAAIGGNSIAPDDVSGPVTWGNIQVTSLKHLRFSGQPDAPALNAAKANGVEVVINLRAPSESEWPEATAAADRGLIYYNVPVDADAPFSRAAFERIEALIAEHPGQTTLIHCSTGNRAAGWLATHLVTRHQMSVSDAIAVARKAGITKDAIVSKVDRYLEEKTTAGTKLEP